MTTVAWRGSQIAADTRCNQDGLLSKLQKLYKVRPNIFIGFAGNWPTGKNFVDWYDKIYLEHKGIGHVALPRFILWGDEKPDFCAIVLDKTGANYWDNSMTPEPMKQDFYAIGTGAMAAMAAMLMGASPVRAVKIASALDPNTGDEIEKYTIRK